MTDCKHCGACCNVLAVLGPMDSDPDTRRWLLDHENTAQHGSNIFIMGRCIHLRKDNSCRIYANRPEICREFKRGGEACVACRTFLGGGNPLNGIEELSRARRIKGERRS